MKRKRNPSSIDHSFEIEPITRLWLLRILMLLGGHRHFIGSHGFESDTLALALGLGFWFDPLHHQMPSFLKNIKNIKNIKSNHNGDTPETFDPKIALTDLRHIYQHAEKQKSNSKLSPCLENNIKKLSTLVGLSETDCRILEFTVIMNNERLLDDTADYLGQLSSVKVFHALSVILALPESDIRASLSAQGLLARSGLVSVDRSITSTLRNKLDLLSDVFADLLITADADPINLLKGTVSAIPPGELQLSDYIHIQPSLAILHPYLRHATQVRQQGVNIFLYGVPGTGKSQLARTLARELDCELFEVASEDADGDPTTGSFRLRAFRAAQSFFAQRQALIVFDEVEDVFNDGDSTAGRRSTAQVRKAWINRMLEGNPVPTLWLSNSIEGLDRAFIRRFDMVFELPVPPKQQRTRILETHCGDLLDTSTIARIAQAEALAPSVVVKAGSVVRTIQKDLGQPQLASAFERLISNTLEAQGHRPLRKHDTNQLPDVYEPRFVHTDVDLTHIVTGLKTTRMGRLCLYGASGTGKTAYGRWLAEQLEQPLLIKRTSDLMSKWVGESEQNIARAFLQAEQEQAILLMDEVDSFLQDRRGANQGWEVSMVNEMLTQMESFTGVFIATTNLMKNLDQAALRRFDLKIKFDYLHPDQAWLLFVRYCMVCFNVTPPPTLIPKIQWLKNLTPGDFAAVARQHRLGIITTPDAFIEALMIECTLKDTSATSIGFV